MLKLATTLTALPILILCQQDLPPERHEGHRELLRELEKPSPFVEQFSESESKRLLALVLSALETEPSLEKGILRVRAYEALGRVGEHAETGALVAADLGLVDRLAEGLGEEDDRIRFTCASTLGATIEPHVSVAAGALTLALLDPSSTVAHQAALSLGRLGPPAKASLPALERILVVDPTLPEREPGPDRAREQQSLRTAAAVARVRIAGGAVDLALYPELDAGGRFAATYALVAHLGDALESAGKTGPVAVVPAVVSALGAMLVDSEVDAAARADGVRMLSHLVAAPAVSEEVELAARRALEGAQGADDATVRDLARVALER